MDFTALGRAHSRASVIGLGTGGPSRVGLSYGHSTEKSVAVVQEALRLGVNVIDTAQGYGSESIVGTALSCLDTDISRSELVICSKAPCQRNMETLSMADFKSSVYGSLEKMGLDYLDVYYIHALYTEHVDHALHVILPGLQDLKREGVVRSAGVSEHFNSDTRHESLLKLLKLGPELVDVLMVGFNILNPSARRELLPLCLKHGVGVTCMFAVRQAFSQPQVLTRIVGDLVESGQVEEGKVNLADPLDFLIDEGHASSITEAAYRYCRQEPGIDVVLSGTGNLDHLRQNVKFILQPPLPPLAKDRLDDIFGQVDSVSGQDKPYKKK